MVLWRLGRLASRQGQLERPDNMLGQTMLVSLQMALLLLALISTSNAQEVHDGGFEGSSSHWMHVRKCCPQAHIMVEVASRPSANFAGHGSKFECQMPNDTTFRWAPDFLNERGSLLPFEENFDFEEAGDPSDVNITTLCVPNGPCISPIIGKPECGPVKKLKSIRDTALLTTSL